MARVYRNFFDVGSESKFRMILLPSAENALKNLLVVILVLMVSYLAFEVHRQTTQLRDLEAQPKVLPIATLEQQERCAKQSESVFSQEGYKEKPLADFTNHFNVKLGKCFIQITNTTATGSVVSTYKILFDAFEGKVYGNYSWINAQGKKFWEVSPSECQVTFPSGEEKKCGSSDEYDDLSKVYME